jgi:hypothetical protein
MQTKPPVRLENDCAHLFSLASDGAISIARMNLPLCSADRVAQS